MGDRAAVAPNSGINYYGIYHERNEKTDEIKASSEVKLLHPDGQTHTRTDVHRFDKLICIPGSSAKTDDDDEHKKSAPVSDIIEHSK